MTPRPKILIVDTDVQLVAHLSALLEGDGFDVESASDGASALRVCQAKLPQLLLTEGLIPRLNGLDLAKKVRALPGGAKLPVLLMSVLYAGPKFRNAREEAGIRDVLAKPFSDEEVLRRVQALVSSEAPRAVEAEFRHSGTLADTAFIRIVFHLFSRKETGTLRLESGTSKKLVTFEGGEPKLVVSNLEQECLGQILVRKGRLTEEDCQRSLELMAKLKKRQGEALVALGLLEPFELDEALKQQAREKFCELFSWREGSYRFVRGKMFQKELTPVDLSVAPLCLRAVREHYPLALLQAELAPFLHVRPRIRNRPVRFEDYKFAAWDVKVVRQIQLGKTLAEVLGMRLGREIDIYHLYYALGALETIELKTGLSPPKAPPAPEGEISSPFAVLGVDENTRDDEIRAAFERKMAALGEADDTSERARALRRAYETICTFQGRRDYLLRVYETEGKLTPAAREVFGPGELAALGKRFLERQDHGRASKVFEDGMKLFPDSGLIFALYGHSKIDRARAEGPVDRGDFEKWKRFVIRGTQLSPSEAEAHYLIGRVFLLEGNHDQAKAAFRTALRYDEGLRAAEAELRRLSGSAKKGGEQVPAIRWKG